MNMMRVVDITGLVLLGVGLFGLVHAGDQPSEIRLAFVPNGMTVSWSTGAAPAVPTVYYGLIPSNLSSTATGTSATYGTEYFNDVVITGLQPFTEYWYSIAYDNTQTTPVSFTTARAAGDASAARVVIVGDMGLWNSGDTMTSMRKYLNGSDFFYHVGDISYADDWYLRPGDNYEASWVKWLAEMEPITSQKAYMTLPGNHEASCTEVTPLLCPEEQKNFTAYRYRFRMPSPESGGVENLWYSFDYGLTHFISISTETDFPNAPEGPGTWLSSGPFGDQLSWLASDLAHASSNRAHVPWIVVLGHRPLYYAGGTEAAIVNAFEPLFTQYHVDLYICGHEHNYQRNWPVAPGGVVSQKSYDNPTSPVYLINGAAGSVEGHTAGWGQAWTAYADTSNYGYGILDVMNSTQLIWGFYKSSDMTLLDTITINKSH